tara:strand:- start:554 stop:871 length:318 start_codon:yes stop_codon:yes gene_type:complete
MSAYGVRLSEDHQAVGIFWAESLNDLFWAIDECCDPNECEIKKLKAGGIMWEGKVSMKFPDNGHGPHLTFDDASYSGQTYNDLDSPDGWRPVHFEWGYPDREATA